jgi:hypothetical protein
MRLALALTVGLAFVACGDDGAKSEDRLAPTHGAFARPSSRALTSKDVETFLAIYPALRDAKSDVSAMRRAIEGGGADPNDWHMTQARILLAYSSLMMADVTKEAVSEDARADADVVRPFSARITEAIRPR